MPESSPLSGTVSDKPSTAPPAPHASERHSRQWLAVALLIAFFRALPNITYPIGRDQATYCVIARGLLQGDRLYQTLWDIKPPGIFWLYEPIVKLFGTAMWSAGVMDLLWLLAVSYCIFRFAERILGTAPAVIAVAINAEWHCQAGYESAAQADAFLILFALAACLAVWSKRYPPVARHFLGGLLLGAAFWLKYNALAFLPLLILLPYVDWSGLDSRPVRVRLLVSRRVWFKRTVVVIVGWISTMVAVLGYFRVSGQWTALWESHFLVLRRYGATPLGWTGYWTTPFYGTLLYLGGLTFLIPFLALVVAWKKRELGRLAPVLVATALGYGLVATQFRFFRHTFDNCYPFFAMVWGYVGIKAFEAFIALQRGFMGPRERVGRVLVWAVFASCVVWPLVPAGSAVVKRYDELLHWSRSPSEFYAGYPEPFRDEDLGEQLQVIALLKQQGAPGDRLFIWGHYPLLFWYSGLRPATRFVSFWPLIEEWGPPAWRQECIRDLKSSAPAFVVTHGEDRLSVFPELDAFVSGSYRKVSVFGRFTVYRRNADSGPIAGRAIE